MAALMLVANHDRRGHKETCGEAWEEEQLGRSGAREKERLVARTMVPRAAWVHMMAGDAEISGAYGHVTVLTIQRAGGQKPSHTLPH